MVKLYKEELLALLEPEVFKVLSCSIFRNCPFDTLYDNFSGFYSRDFTSIGLLSV
jgi:hypothetical protein